MSEPTSGQNPDIGLTVALAGAFADWFEARARASELFSRMQRQSGSETEVGAEQPETDDERPQVDGERGEMDPTPPSNRPAAEADELAYATGWIDGYAAGKRVCELEAERVRRVWTWAQARARAAASAEAEQSKGKAEEAESQ